MPPPFAQGRLSVNADWETKRLFADFFRVDFRPPLFLKKQKVVTDPALRICNNFFLVLIICNQKAVFAKGENDELRSSSRTSAAGARAPTARRGFPAAAFWKRRAKTFRCFCAAISSQKAVLTRSGKTVNFIHRACPSTVGARAPTARRGIPARGFPGRASPNKADAMRRRVSSEGGQSGAR